MVGTLKRAIQKIVVSNRARAWHKSLGEMFGGYRRRPVTDGKSLLEKLFGIQFRFLFEPNRLDVVSFNTDLAREFEIEIVKSDRHHESSSVRVRIGQTNSKSDKKYSCREAGKNGVQ